MEYKVVETDERMIKGFSAQIQEMDPSGSRVSELWQRFYKEKTHNSVPLTVGPYKSISVSYNQRQKGISYDILMSCECEQGHGDDSYDSFVIPSGKYAQIHVPDASPDGICRAWESIWADSELMARRSYAADVKAYYPLETGGADIFLSLTE